MRVAVTGVTGLVGGQVARAALDAGHEVVAITRSGTGATLALGDRRVARVTAALTDRAGLRRALDGCDGLVHCAAVYAFGPEHEEQVRGVNVAGTRGILEAAADVGTARAVVTTSSVTRGSSREPLARSERDTLGDEPAPAYYESKVAQEEAALEVGARRGIEVVLALPTLALGGPYRRLAPSNAIVLRYLLDPTRSTFAGGGNVVDARDVGAGHVLLLERGTPGERYLLGGENLSWRAVHGLVADLAGLPGPFAEVSPGMASALAATSEWWGRVSGRPALSTREEAATIGRYYWYASDSAASLGYAARSARMTVAAAVGWLAVSPDLPRWVRESLRLHPDVRAARELVPAPLPEPGELADAAAAAVRPRPRRPPPRSPRRPPSP